MPSLKYKDAQGNIKPVRVAAINVAQYPELDNPAAVTDVTLGKEYIDENGQKQTGTFVPIANNMRETVLLTTTSDMTLNEVLAAVEYKCYYKNGFIGLVFEGDNPTETSRSYSFASFANWHTGTNTYIMSRAPLATTEAYKSGNVSANTAWASGTYQPAHYLFAIEANTGRIASIDSSALVGGTGTTVTLYEFPIYWDVDNKRFVEDLTKWGE